MFAATSNPCPARCGVDTTLCLRPFAFHALGPTEACRSPRTSGVAMPGFIEPCDPVLRDKAPVGDSGLYEIKSDGYRAQLHVRRDDTVVYSRSGYDWTEQFA